MFAAEMQADLPAPAHGVSALSDDDLWLLTLPAFHQWLCRSQVTDLKLKVVTAEQEREFYFNKLRDIEILCQLDEIKTQPVSPACDLVEQCRL
jgi:hypothetical protein